MIERFDRIENRKEGLKSYYNRSVLRCPPGYTWVSGHTRNGRLVKGYCKRIKYYQIEKVTIENSRKYGWNKGPVFIKEERVTETFRKFNNSLEGEQ